MPVQKTDRKEILKRSLHVFKEKGYHKTTMADLATASGLLKGSMYHYFSGKEELMAEVLKMLKNHYVDKVFSIAYDRSFPAILRLQKLAARSEEIFIKENGGCFMVNTGLETVNTNKSFTTIIRDFFNEWIKCIAYIYKEIYTPSEAESQARYAVAEIEGSVMLMQIYNDPNYLLRTNKKLIADFRKSSEKQ